MHWGGIRFRIWVIGSVAVIVTILCIPAYVLSAPSDGVHDVSPALGCSRLNCGGSGDNGTGGGGGGNSCQAVHLAATLTYNDNNGREQPIKAVRVEVWRFTPGAFGIYFWGMVGALSTSAAGQVDVDEPFDRGDLWALRVVAQNAAGRIFTSVVPSTYFTDPGPDHSPIQRKAETDCQRLDFTYNFTDSFRAAVFNVLDALTYGRDWATKNLDNRSRLSSLPPVQVVVNAFSTFYDPVTQTENLQTANTMQDGSILHEYGHFLEQQLSTIYALPSYHDGCHATVLVLSADSEQLAWMEGFADWFSAMLLKENPDLVGQLGTESTGDMERKDVCGTDVGPPPDLPPNAGLIGTPGGYIEDRVAGILWDLAKQEPGNGESDKSSGEVLIFKIMEDELSYPEPRIDDFHRAWRSRGLDRGIDGIFSKNYVGIP